MSETAQLVLLIVASLLAALGISVAAARPRCGLLGAALVVAFALVCGLAWDGALEAPREHPLLLAVAVLVALALLSSLAWLLRSRMDLVPLLLIAALPFRIPVDIGSSSSNLLVPLYLVIAVALVAAIWNSMVERSGTSIGFSDRPLDLVLGIAILIFALQAIYSQDVPAAARTTAFFLVPFAALYALLVDVDWSRDLLFKGLVVIGAEAALFALVGITQAGIGEIFWNPALMASNDFHLYFRANSLFWDPNIFGRYLALAITVVVAAIVWIDDRRKSTVASLGVALLWVGLLFAWSQSSFISLIAGLLVLLALRYRLRWAVIAAPIAVVGVVAAVVAGAGDGDSRGAAATATSGRTSLVSGGLALAADRPLAGWGSGSFSRAFAQREGLDPDQTSISHNEVVTVAAEQGLVGLLVYALVLVAACWTLFGSMRRVAPGLGGTVPNGLEPAASVRARIALAAAFCLILAHTMGYAGFLTDPLSWAILAVAAALGARVSKRG